MLFMTPNQQCQSTEDNMYASTKVNYFKLKGAKLRNRNRPTPTYNDIVRND